MILKVKDLIDKNEVQLKEELSSLQDKLFESKMSFHARKLENTSTMREMRKSIARILTILQARKEDKN